MSSPQIPTADHVRLVETFPMRLAPIDLSETNPGPSQGKDYYPGVVIEDHA